MLDKINQPPQYLIVQLCEIPNLKTAARPEDLSSVPGVHIVEEKKQLLQFIIWSPLAECAHQKKINRSFLKKIKTIVHINVFLHSKTFTEQEEKKNPNEKWKSAIIQTGEAAGVRGAVGF